jgi:hypothetical protein
MKGKSIDAIRERIQGTAPSRWRALAMSVPAGAAVAVVVYRVLRKPS